MSTPVNLIARLPTIMQKYDEIVKITDSQNPEFDLLWAVEEWMRRQLYITTAEEYGLSRYERLLGIAPLPGESFEARRNHILVRWNTQTPYTMRFLVGLLEAITNGNFEINTNFTDYEMEIVLLSADTSLLQDLAFIKRHIVPANINTSIIREITAETLDATLYVAAIFSGVPQTTLAQWTPPGMGEKEITAAVVSSTVQETTLDEL